MSEEDPSPVERWAHFRFSVIGPLLAAPPSRGELENRIHELAAQTWLHPTLKEPTRFAFSTIQRWYYQARPEDNPVRALQRKPRTDRGQTKRLSPELAKALVEQYNQHPSWSYQLHTDNLAVLVEGDPSLAPMPSYSSICRFLHRRGLRKQRRARSPRSPGARRAAKRLELCEVRSYEAEYVGGLWHVDFHHGSLHVLTREGSWVRPILLALIDDHSRLCCHAQWYFSEDTEALVHGCSQGFQKRGLPRALMSDNGAGARSQEFRTGTEVLSIVLEYTLPFSAYQNAKQESFWGTAEGRLVAMLEGVKNLSLRQLNEATQAWVELEYNRKPHSEIGMSPLERFLKGPSVLRKRPSSESLRQAFRREVARIQRRSDGTISLESQRFEIPSRYRTLRRIHVRYASWDLSRVEMVDPHSGTSLGLIYPIDKVKNAEGTRRRLEPVEDSVDTSVPKPSGEAAPLLQKLLAQYAATGLPPAYIPRSEEEER